MKIAINKLHPFYNHPFKVIDNAEMDDLVLSIKEQGILTPIIVRPLENTSDEFEIISGHRRYRAAQLLGKKEIEVSVRYVNRDEAAVMLVDSNLHRSRIVPSEKAFAYKSSRKSLWTSCPQVKRYCFQHRQRKAGAAIHQTDEVDSAAFENG